MRARLLVAALVVAAAIAGGARPAEAAGIITHGWMAEEAIAFVEDPALAALLRAQREQVRAGAAFPDGGYATERAGVTGGDYGEEAHWHRFHTAYLDVIRARTDCGTITDPHGPCAPAIAHLFGVAAHGVGDEVWDWLFEPAAADHDELWIPPGLEDQIPQGGLEVQMDAVAVADHGRNGGAVPPEPSVDDVLAAFSAAGAPDITATALAEGRRSTDDLRALEVAGAGAYRDALHANMPWTSANVITAAGGIRFTARAAAALYDSLWARLRGGEPPTRVAVTAPADGALDVPASGWAHEHRPGAWPHSYGADTRIVAVLSWGLPFVPPDAPPGTHIDAELPEGAAYLTERDTGRSVPLQPGYPRIVPYDPDRGGHQIGLQPAGDLAPCTWYRVGTTDRLRDADGRTVTPTSWTFRTAGCPSDPAPTTTAPVTAVAGVGTDAPAPVPVTPRYTG